MTTVVMQVYKYVEITVHAEAVRKRCFFRVNMGVAAVVRTIRRLREDIGEVL